MTKIGIEQHDVVPMAAKKVWNVLRVIYSMLRKVISLSRRKLLSDLNLTMKRGKIASKAISSLITFSHHGPAAGHNDHSRAASSTSSTAAEFEFRCSKSPAIGGYYYQQNYLNSHFFSSLHMDGERHSGGNNFHGFFGCAHLPKAAGDDEAEAEAVAADVPSFGFNDSEVMATIEAEQADWVSEVASPLLPGFVKTPLPRHLRITDSPFPLKDDGDGGKVDKAAEEFIQKFYRALQKQKSG